MDGMKTLHIGVAPPGYVKRRMMEIARGGKLLPGEPPTTVTASGRVGPPEHPLVIRKSTTSPAPVNRRSISNSFQGPVTSNVNAYGVS